jgi:hypothetical protein
MVYPPLAPRRGSRVLPRPDNEASNTAKKEKGRAKKQRRREREKAKME